VSEYWRYIEGHYCNLSRLQFISQNNTRSRFSDTKANNDPQNEKWTEKKMQEAKEVHRVETIFCKEDGLMCGFRFFAQDGSKLLNCGAIENRKLRDSPKYTVINFYLEKDERIVGIKSASRGFEEAAHFSF
jgi:hypothetical protein